MKEDKEALDSLATILMRQYYVPMSVLRKILITLRKLGYRKLPKDKPPIIALDGLYGKRNPDIEKVQQAQREADIQYYREAK